VYAPAALRAVMPCHVVTERCVDVPCSVVQRVLLTFGLVVLIPAENDTGNNFEKVVRKVSALAILVHAPNVQHQLSNAVELTDPQSSVQLQGILGDNRLFSGEGEDVLLVLFWLILLLHLLRRDKTGGSESSEFIKRGRELHVEILRSGRYAQCRNAGALTLTQCVKLLFAKVEVCA